MNYLETIFLERQAAVELAKRERPLAALVANIDPEFKPLSLEKVLSESQRIGIIAEIKRASPSEGLIRPSVDVSRQALQYVVGGAIGVSVLTEPAWFHGSMLDLIQVRESLKDFPGRFLLRKDFIFSEYQIVESVVAKADTVLLIVAVLCLMWKNPSEAVGHLRQLLHCCRRYGLEPLVEVFNKVELEHAVSAGAKVIGINNRNLHSFTVGFEGTLELLSLMPQGIQTVILSGIRKPADLAPFTARGIHHFLVGTGLMKAVNPTRSIAVLSKTPPLLKITGIHSPEQAGYFRNLPIAMVSLVFGPSKHPAAVPIEVAKQIRKSLGPRIPPPCLPNLLSKLDKQDYHAFVLEQMAQSSHPLLVGIFTDEDPSEINRISEAVDLDFIQLDGGQPYHDIYCRPVIKSYSFSVEDSDVDSVPQVDGRFPYLLFHIKTPPSFESFDIDQAPFQKLCQMKDATPLMVGGEALNFSTITILLDTIRPWIIDIVVNSGRDGSMDLHKVEEIIKYIKN